MVLGEEIPIKICHFFRMRQNGLVHLVSSPAWINVSIFKQPVVRRHCWSEGEDGGTCFTIIPDVPSNGIEEGPGPSHGGEFTGFQ